MQIIGFNFTKIAAHRAIEFSLDKTNMNIDFLSIEKEKSDILKDNDILRTAFKLALEYTEKETKKESNPAEIIFEGSLLLTTTPEESKEIFKLWKKKEITPQLRAILFNNVVRRCSSLTILLQDHLNLPSPFLNLPRANPQQNP